MSVINDMLKDLERRQYQQPTTVGGYSMQGLRTVTPALGGKHTHGWVIGTLVLICCFWLIWLLSSEIPAGSISIPLGLPPEQVKIIEVPEMVSSQMVVTPISKVEVPVQAIDGTMPLMELDSNEVPNLPDTPTEDAISAADQTSVSIPSVLESKLKIESPQTQPKTVKKIKDGYVAAQQALKRGQPIKAVQLLEAVLVGEPKHLPASLLLSRLYLESNRSELATMCTLSALQYHPRQVELVTYLVRSLLGQGHLDEASEYLEENLHEWHAPHLGLMAVIYQRQERHAEASRFYRRALQLVPDEVTWLAGLAISQEHLGEMEAALVAYRRSLMVGGLNAALRDFVTARIDKLNGYE